MSNLKMLQDWQAAAKTMRADDTLTAYTKLVAEVIGISSSHLLQWALDCGFGDVPLYAGKRRLATVEDVYDHFKRVFVNCTCGSV